MVAAKGESKQDGLGGHTLLPFLFLLILSTSSWAQEVSVDAIGRRVQPSVLLVLEKAPSGEVVAAGSGFLVSPDGKVVTSDHGEKKAEQLSVQGSDGRVYRVVKILERDPREGRELLQLDATGLPFLPLFSPVPVHDGERVVIVSSRFAWNGGISSGRAMIDNGFLRAPRLQVITGAVSRLYPGSPVVGERGEVLGVAKAKPLISKPGKLVILVATIGALSVAPKSDRSRPTGTSSPKATAEKPVRSLGVDSSTAPIPLAEEEGDREVAQLFSRSMSDQEAAAWASLQHGNDANAAAAFEEELRKRSSEARIWLGFGLAKRGLGQAEEARMGFQQAIRLNPAIELAWRELGEVDLQIKRYPEASDSFGRAVQIRPKDARAWFGVAAADLALQKRREAGEALDRVCALAPRDAELWMGVAKAYSRLDRQEDAATAYQHVLDRNPKDARALLGLGLVSIELGRTERAEEILSRLLELDEQMGMELVEALKKR